VESRRPRPHRGDLRVLGQNPGKAVKQAATEALDDGSAKALAQDDEVAVFSALGSAGPYTKMAVTVALDAVRHLARPDTVVMPA
jgi:hypothetical protein